MSQNQVQLPRTVTLKTHETATIRKAIPYELPRLRQIADEATPEGWKNGDPDWPNLINQGFMYAVEMDSQIVAFAVYEPASISSSGVDELGGVYVLPQYRERGIAS